MSAGFVDYLSLMFGWHGDAWPNRIDQATTSEVVRRAADTADTSLRRSADTADVVLRRYADTADATLRRW